MPKLAPIVRDLSTIPEGLRAYYTKDSSSGQYVLEVDVAQHPTVAALQRQNTQLAATASEHAVRHAIAEAGGNVHLLTPVVLQHVQMQEQDGALAPVVVDGRGQPRIAKRGAHMTVADLLTEMKGQADYASAFGEVGAGRTTGPAGASGGSAHGSQGGRGAPSGIRSLKDFRSTADKVAWIDQHGADAYSELPAE